jgi:hypothetical protein
MDIHVYGNIFTMHGPMNVKFPNNTSKWQMEFNSEFKGLMAETFIFPSIMQFHKAPNSMHDLHGKEILQQSYKLVSMHTLLQIP